MASAAFAFINGGAKSPGDTTVLSDGGSNKRKRSDIDVGHSGEDGAAQEEIKRLREEVGELRRQLQEQTRHADEMRAQLQAVNAAISQTLAVPQPPVL